MSEFLPRARRLVVILAVLGLLLGSVTAYITLRQERFLAHATLAMLPGPNVPPEEALLFWEVLNRGQATRTAALTLQDPRWSGLISTQLGILPADFTLSAAAIPETTLIEVSVQANSAWAAERALSTVLADGVPYAASVSGPFVIETVNVEYAPATSLSPTLMQQVAAFGLAGLLVGAGAGFLISRVTQRRKAPAEPAPVESVPEHEMPTSQIAVQHAEASGVEQVKEAGFPPKRAR